MYALSYNIVEGLALYIQRSIDERAEKSKGSDAELPHYVKIASDEILVAVGKSRNLDEKVAAKHAVLSAVAAAIKALATTTKSQYPEIVDSTGAAL
jgi:tRNA(Arg) A34 adenosine deaminase TadA